MCPKTAYCTIHYFTGVVKTFEIAAYTDLANINMSGRKLSFLSA